MTDGDLNKPSRGYNRNNRQDMVFDLGSPVSASRITYTYCKAKATDGGVKDFAFFVGDTINSGPWFHARVVGGKISENVENNLIGERLEFNFPEETVGQFWKRSSLNNHGNMVIIYTCEIELTGGTLPTPVSILLHLFI